MYKNPKVKELQEQIISLKKELDFYKTTAGRMSLAFDAVEDGLWDYNFENQNVYFNPSYYTMLGYEPYELPESRQTWIDLLHPEDREKTVNFVDECIQNAKNWSVEFRLRTKDGNYKWVLGRGKVARFCKEGRPIRRVGTHTDIDERKNIELEREQLLKDLKNALQTVDALRGMIPICTSCKQIRDDKGFWSQVEEYIQLHSQAEFTHSICPDCAEKLYGDEDWFNRKDFP